MNIIITVESYSPLKNGVQEITQSYAEALAQNNNVVVITKSVKNQPNIEWINGVKVIRVDVFTKKSIYYGAIDKYKKILLENSKKSDIMINICTQTAFTDCILNELSEISCKKVLYLHGIAHFTFPNIPRRDIHDLLSWMLNVMRWKNFYKRNLKNFEKYDAIIHLHEYDRSYLMCKKLNVENIVLENFSKNNMLYRTDVGDDSSYLMIANYIHDKNQELAIQSYCMSESHRGLVFVGSSDTKYLKKLKKMVQKLETKTGHMGEICFIVAETHTNTMQRLNNAYALIHSSKSEKYPVVLCEAMKGGIPFLATNTGIIKFLPGGIIVNNKIELMNAINKIDKDVSFRNSLGKQGKNYSLNKQVFENNKLKLQDLLEKIVYCE